MKTLRYVPSLALTSAVTAEFLLGDQYLGGMASAGQQLAQLVLFTAFYGSAAVLIREIARRTRAGWPCILILALAFGVLEEGVVTQSLFNPNYVGQHLLAYGFIPVLGTAGPWLVFVLTLHVVWSIGSPIALIEGIGGIRPWMRPGWLAVPAVLFVLGALAIFVASWQSGQFMARPGQLIVSGAISVILVVVALTVLRHRPTPAPGETTSLPRYALAAGAGLVLSGAFQLVYGIPHGASAWLVVPAQLVIIAIGIAFAVRFRPDPAAFGSGAILTYCVVGLGHAIGTGPGAVVEQVVLVALALALLALVARKRAYAPAAPRLA